MSNSFAEYLHALPAWDARPRVSRFLHDYLGAPSASEAEVAALARWLVSAVARAIDPGCEVDGVVLVLVGPQGKSAAFRALAGDFHRELLAPRVFVATAGSADFLQDPTEGRRFWPVRVGTCDVEGIRRDRDQIWAEAFEAYRQVRDLHEVRVVNTADGNDGMRLSCSCRWTRDFDGHPVVEEVAAAAAAHRADAAGLGGAPRREFKSTLRALGYVQRLSTDLDEFTCGDVRVHVGWDAAHLERGKGGAWESFEKVLDVATRFVRAGMCQCRHHVDSHAGLGTSCQISGCLCNLFAAVPRCPDFRLTARETSGPTSLHLEWAGSFEEVRAAYVSRHPDFRVHELHLLAQDGRFSRHPLTPWLEIQIPQEWYEAAVAARRTFDEAVSGGA